MTNRTHQLTPLDHRVQSGSKIIADGEFALSMTMNELKAASWIAKATCGCGCGGTAYLDRKQIAAAGLSDVPLSVVVPKLKNASRCRGAIVITIIDPWSYALDT